MSDDEPCGGDPPCWAHLFDEGETTQAAELPRREAIAPAINVSEPIVGPAAAPVTNHREPSAQSR